MIGSQREKLTPLKLKILDSYPRKIPENDHQYIDSLQMICFPEGYELEEVYDTHISLTLSINHFIITGADGLHKYATALAFTQMRNLHLDPLDDLDPKLHKIPMAFCLVSSLPVFDFHKYDLLVFSYINLYY